MAKKVIEGELVNHERTPNSSNNNQTFFEAEKIINNIPGWRLLFCLFPIFGLLFAISWYYYYKSKQNIEIIFPMIGIIIGLFSTITFIILRFILKAIF